MSADQNRRVDVAVGADLAGLKPGMQDAGKAVEDFGKKAESTGQNAGRPWTQIGPIFQDVANSAAGDLAGTALSSLGAFGTAASNIADSVRGKWDELPAVFRGAGVAVAGAAILAGLGVAAKRLGDEFSETVETTMDFARALGTSTNEASVLQAALEGIGASPAEFQAAAKGLSRQLRENEADLQAMGLATRDSAGQLRPLNQLTQEAIGLLGSYKQGADQALAGQTLFGRGIDASSRLLLLNKQAVEEARVEVEALGLMVGANAVAAFEDFDAASDKSTLVLNGLWRAIQEAVLPVGAQLVELFNATLPAATVVVRGALSGLSAAFISLGNGIVVVWELIGAVLMTITDPIVQTGSAIAKLLSGDFAGAAAEMRAIPGNIATAWEDAFTRIGDSSAKTRERLGRLYDGLAGIDGGAGSGGADGGTKGFVNLGGTAPPKTPTAGKPADDGVDERALERLRAMERRMEAEQRAMNERLAGQARQLSQIQIDSQRDAILSGIALEEEGARQRLSRGEITGQQLLALEAQFEQMRQQARQQALQQALLLVDPQRDPVQYAQILAQIQALEQQHALAMAQIQGRADQQTLGAQTGLANSVTSLWQRGMQALQQGTLTWRGAWQAVLGEVGQAAMKTFQNIVLSWIQSNTTMKLVGKETSLAMIHQSAMEAGAGAYKAVVGIPIIGPVLAPAAAAVAYAGTMAFASAEGGYDIPAGVNPLVQAHAREMVLPAEHADVIRSLADGGMGGGGGAAVTFNFRQSREGYIETREDEFLREFGRLNRNFKLKRS